MFIVALVAFLIGLEIGFHLGKIRKAVEEEEDLEARLERLERLTGHYAEGEEE